MIVVRVNDVLADAPRTGNKRLWAFALLPIAMVATADGTCRREDAVRRRCDGFGRPGPRRRANRPLSTPPVELDPVELVPVPTGALVAPTMPALVDGETVYRGRCSPGPQPRSQGLPALYWLQPAASTQTTVIFRIIDHGKHTSLKMLVKNHM